MFFLVILVHVGHGKYILNGKGDGSTIEAKKTNY